MNKVKLQQKRNKKSSRRVKLRKQKATAFSTFGEMVGRIVYDDSRGRTYGDQKDLNKGKKEMYALNKQHTYRVLDCSVTGQQEIRLRKIKERLERS